MREFRVHVPQDDLDDLHRRLDATRWPERLPGPGWERGVPTDYLRELVAYWRHDFSWRAAEASINRFPQYIDTIDGADVHFLHVRSPEPDAVPLLVTHGWPGSVVEFLDVVGPLTDPRAHGGDPADAFHLVIPSMPGFGFSGPPAETGWTLMRVAGAWAELMRRLGYDRYVPQGADFGSPVSLMLAAIDPEHVAGVHLNLLITPPSGEPGELDGLAADDVARLARAQRFRSELSGSMALQATRPNTIAYSLCDSPVGQLAWIVEKFKDWTDSARVPEDAVARDHFLTLASVFWFTATGGSSAQMYYEVRDQLPIAMATGRNVDIAAPLGVAVFPEALFAPVRRLADRDFSTICHWREYDRGGHFAALEEPDLFVSDLQEFRRALKG